MDSTKEGTSTHPGRELSIPTGATQGLPTGVQVVAAPYREDLCFEAAAIIETHHPMPTPIDPPA